HLFENEAILKHPIVRDVRDEIELSFGNRWDEPGVEGYIATILDPRFKDLSFEPEKLEPMKNELKCRMEAAKNINSTIPSIENRSSSFLLNSLFEKTFQEIVSRENNMICVSNTPPKRPKITKTFLQTCCQTTGESQTGSKKKKNVLQKIFGESFIKHAVRPFSIVLTNTWQSTTHSGNTNSSSKSQNTNHKPTLVINLINSVISVKNDAMFDFVFYLEEAGIHRVPGIAGS
ncbi:1522_t:CDS:2, partial [Gigaspora rosea]